MKSKSTLFIASLFFSFSIWAQGIDSAKEPKHQIEPLFLIQRLSLFNQDIQQTGTGASIGKRTRSGSIGLGLGYTYHISSRHGINLDFRYLFDLPSSESFELNPPLVNGNNSFGGYTSYGISFSAFAVQAKYQFLILKTPLRSLGFGVGPGMLFWDNQADQKLIFNFINPTDQTSVPVEYGHLSIESPVQNLFLGAHLNYQRQWSSKIGVKFQIDYQHFINPVYNVQRLDLSTSEQNSGSFSYQKRAIGLAYTLGIQFKL